MEKITLEYVEKQLILIESLKSDPESAHLHEDDLLKDFIECISKGMYDNIEECISVAKLVFKVHDINYPRWYA